MGESRGEGGVRRACGQSERDSSERHEREGGTEDKEKVLLVRCAIYVLQLE